MGSSDNVAVYVMVFTVVFLPYLILSMFIRMPDAGAKDVVGRNLPSVFRAFWRPLQLFSESLGSSLAAMQPRRREKIASLLKIANIRMFPEHVFALEFLLSLTFSLFAVLIILLVTHDVVKFATAFFIGGVMGLIWPIATVSSAAESRQNAIMKALPFSIDLIGSAMRSGVDFTAAVRYYVMNANSKEPIVVEFGIMLRELELGKTRIDALTEMADRVRISEFSAFVDAVVHGLEVGASIVGTMKVQAEGLRRIRFNKAERRAARAVSSMIIPIAIFIMPAMFLIIGTPILLRVISSGLGGLMQ